MKARNPILAVLALTVLVALYFAHREARTPIEPAAPPRLGAPAPNPQEQNEAAGRETGPATEVTPPSPLGSTETRIPPFHPSAAAAQPLPRTLPSTEFAIPIVARAYEIAARIPKVLAQQPCYCWCDRYGHRSLLDCFASDHGAG